MDSEDQNRDQQRVGKDSPSTETSPTKSTKSSTTTSSSFATQLPSYGTTGPINQNQMYPPYMPNITPQGPPPHTTPTDPFNHNYLYPPFVPNTMAQSYPSAIAQNQVYPPFMPNTIFQAPPVLTTSTSVPRPNHSPQTARLLSLLSHRPASQPAPQIPMRTQQTIVTRQPNEESGRLPPTIVPSREQIEEAETAWEETIKAREGEREERFLGDLPIPSDEEIDEVNRLRHERWREEEREKERERGRRGR